MRSRRPAGRVGAAPGRRACGLPTGSTAVTAVYANCARAAVRRHPHPVMPRKHDTLVVASQRIAEARRLVANQEALIANLRVARRATGNAEATLFTYLSALRHLEDQERKIKGRLKARIGETKKKPKT
jgi:hypothetical protein